MPSSQESQGLALPQRSASWKKRHKSRHFSKGPYTGYSYLIVPKQHRPGVLRRQQVR